MATDTRPAMTDAPTRAPRFPLPPRGWPLVLLLAVFIGTGLVGHDPWKNDDAITIGIVHDMILRGHWLLPHLADTPYPDAPLYYWSAALTASLFGWLLPGHDAIRLASGAWIALALWLLYRAGREIHRDEDRPHEYAIASVMLLAGSLGFLIHAHEAQPMLVALAAHAAACWAAALLPRLPRRAALLLALAFATAFLGNGLAPALALVPIAVLGARLPPAPPGAARLAGGGLIAGALLALPWPAWLAFTQGDLFALWWQTETLHPGDPANIPRSALAYLGMLPWFGWPAAPLAAWALWSRRRQLARRGMALPLGILAGVWLMLAVLLDPRSSSALLLLPPLALLGAAGLTTLRRGGAMAFDWFAVMTFSLFALLTWIGWCAMVFGWPARLARRVTALAPGFTGTVEALPLIAALVATAGWVWLVVSNQSQRSPWRGVTHWLAGLGLFWLLLIVLWLPWIEHGKSYRGVGERIRALLPPAAGCVAARDLGHADRAVFDYFAGIALRPEGSPEATGCHWLLTSEALRGPRRPAPEGWVVAGIAQRPGDRSERFVLYRRDDE